MIVKPFYREGGDSGDNPDDEKLTPEDKLAWWFHQGSKNLEREKRFGKRELQKLRATKALHMRKEGKSNDEIAVLLSMGKKRVVKPSSVPAMLSRWKGKRNNF